MRGVVVALAATACASEPAIYTLPEGVETALVLRAGGVELLDRASVWRQESEAVTVLSYAEPAAELLLEADAEGRLLVASAGEESWPLPEPRTSARFMPETGGFSGPLEPAELASLLASVRVPVPRCGALEIVSSERVDADLTAQGLDYPALVDGVVMLSTVEYMGGPAHIYRIQGGVTRELTPELRPYATTRLNVFSERGGFLLVQTSTARSTQYRVTLDGALTVTRDLPSSDPPILHRSARWPGEDAMYSRDDRALTVSRLDLRTGAWTTLADFGVRPPGPDAPFQSDQALVLTAPDRAVVSFEGVPLHELGLDGAPPTRLDPSMSEHPAQSNYLRFASGVELSLELPDAVEAGVYEVAMRYRSSRAEPFRAGPPLASPIADLVAIGERAVGIQKIRDDVVLFAREPRRPDQPPRLCARLGAGNVSTFALDGTEGVAIVREHSLGPASVVHFRVEDP